MLLLNSPSVCPRTIAKTYLRDFDAAGVPVPRAAWVPAGSGETLARILQTHGLDEAVVKPVVSMGGLLRFERSATLLSGAVCRRRRARDYGATQSRRRTSDATMNLLKLLAATGLLAACAGTPPVAPQPPVASAIAPGAEISVRLYALDCGRLELSDVGVFGDTGKPSGKAATFAVPCFVIRHPKGTLLWDTGLDEAIHEHKDGVKNPIATEFVDRSLREQLAALSVAPADVTFVGFSHLHLDHAGNANAFTSSTWLVGRKELESALAKPTPGGVETGRFSAYKSAKIEPLDGDKDVFADGTVQIVQTPGHTPGHQSLVVRLAKSGTLVLSGDLAHTRDNWAHHVVPAFNYSREQTLASMARIDKLLADTHGRFIVQHSTEDFASLPKFPAYLD